jgi:choloylglycine hydrolase
VPDIHIKVQDASGRSIVIEPRGGRLVVHDNPTRVLTNATTFDWQITNLNNDVNLMKSHPTAKVIGAPGTGELTLQPMGMGAGGAGLPEGTSETNADFTTWTAVSDLKNLRFNWHTCGDPQRRSLDLRQALAAAGGKMRLLPMGHQQPTATMPLVPVEVSR